MKKFSRKMKFFGFAIFAITLIFAIFAIARFCFREKMEAPARASEYRNRALDIVVAHLARMEKADAKSVCLADDEAELYRPYFERAGLVCAKKNDDGIFKLIFFAKQTPPKDWQKILAKLAADGVIAWVFESRKKTARDFREALVSFPCAETKVWMPGECDWLLTGRAKASALKLDVLLDDFSAEGAMDDLAHASCDTVAELFANYVGTREEILPAFQGDLNVPARAECFIPQEIPAMEWLVRGETDEDIYAAVRREIRTFQIVRRKVAKGNLLSLKKDGIASAIDQWAAAAVQNPHDTMLLDRLYRLAVNAQAFEKIGQLKGAAKCYETMISVRPNDGAAMARYAACMRHLGFREIADAAAKRARELESRSHTSAPRNLKK